MRGQNIVYAVFFMGTATLGLGCVAHAQATGYAEADAPVVFVAPPTLVEVDADVWVVQDYDYAVYYTGGFYWVYKNDVWWRSQAYDQGWARVDVNVVPAVVIHRDHHAYVRFHGPPAAKTRPAPRSELAADTRHGPPDHAAEQHGGPPGQNEVPGLGNQRKEEGNNPGLGHDADKREEKVERKEEKAEHKEERAEHKEEKKERKDDKKPAPKKK
jgi:hypothetical protein